MSRNFSDSFKHQMHLLQDFRAQSKEFYVLTTLSYLAIGLLVTLFFSRYLTPKGGKGSIRTLGGFPIFTAWKFFSKRHDFILANSGNDPHFKFKVLHHNVVVFRGEESRKAYFDDKDLNFNEGYKVLWGATPNLEEINVNWSEDDALSTNKNIAKLLNKNRLSDVLPTLFSDINKRMETWGKHGQMDPFKTIYDLVFQMTIRMTTCAELANDIEAIEEIKTLYWIMEKSSTPAALLLPWFPSPARRRRNQATRDLFTKLLAAVELRKKAAVPSSDAIDVLLEEGSDTVPIVQFILGLVSAGVTNTGLNSCWALVYLSFNTEWRAKAKAEVDALIQKHTTNSTNEPLYKQLSAIHISAWEDEMPVLDLIIRETLRLSLSGVALRRNLREDITLSGGLVKHGDFVGYPVADVHLNPDIYSSPHKFDPGRFTEGRNEDKKGTFSYLGWGVGRHPCTGKNVAKLEIKIIVAFILAGFEFNFVDKFGNPLAEPPKPNRNDLHQLRPLGDPCYLRFDRIVE